MAGNAAVLFGENYTEKVLRYGPFAHFVQGEAAGVTAIDEINPPAQNGTYTGVTLGETGIGDTNTCPLYDGINDSLNVFSAPWAAAFDGDEGSIVIWAKAFNAATWAGAEQRFFWIRVGATANIISIRKAGAAGRVSYTYQAGGVTEAYSKNGVATLDWFQLGITWSASADLVQFFWNGLREATANTLGVWAGVPTVHFVGAQDAVPNGPWAGYLAHAFNLDYALTEADFADLYVIP
jgi:hypothetical protein